MLSREQLIKFIPKPKNEDVIVYDIELKDFIDKNVIEEYDRDLTLFLDKKEKYDLLKEKIKKVEDFIDNVYLFNPSWKEEDYLIRLRNNKKTYSTLYGKIKKIENNISILQKKLKVMNEKIKIQEEKENLSIKKKKENIDDEIQKDKNSLLDLKEKISFFNLQMDFLNKSIFENQQEFNYLSKMESQLKDGKYRCEFCGSIIKDCSEDSLAYDRLVKKFMSNKQKAEVLLKRKEGVEKEIAYYEDKISKIKTKLNNNINIKKASSNSYIKKSIEILKLEALKDEIMNNIAEQEKQLKSQSSLKSDEYIELKKNIEKYELSLENLHKIREMKESSKEDIENYQNLKKELIEVHERLLKYKKFITLYYKIYEQKANEYFGPNFKFKLFEFDDVILKPMFEVKYKDIEYSKLDEKDKKEVDSIFAEKISIFY